MNQVRLIGLVQLVVAIAAFAVTLLIGWNAWNRWSGINHIRSARTRMVDAYDDSVRRHGAAAAAALPGEPAAVLLDIDLAKDADYPRLEALEKRCSSTQRALVLTAEALSQVLRGKPAADVAGSDGVLLKALADLLKGGKPSAIVLPKDSPPHSSVQVATYIAQLRAALAANDRVLTREAAGCLALMLPASQEGPALDVICAALDTGLDGPKLVAVVQRVRDHGELQDLLRRLSIMAPDRAQALNAVALGIQPDLAPDKALEAEVRAAAGSADAVDVIGLARRCFEAGHPELAKLLLPKLPAEAQSAFRTLVLNQEGDVAELAKVGDASPALAPRIAPTRCRPGLIAFHLSNDFGMVPRSGVTVKIDGNEVPAGKITHFGTLYAIETPSSGVVQLEVRAGTRAVFDGKVTL